MMTQDKTKMTLKTRLSYALSCSVATLSVVLVTTVASAQTNGTAPPPVPFAAENLSGEKNQGNYPPAGFDPEKKEVDGEQNATGGQPPKPQQQWPIATKNAVPSQEYPPQEGINLTPTPKTAVKKPDLKYPPFPSVDWPKKDIELPKYAPFPSVKFPPADTWGPPPQPWASPVWQQPGSGQADQQRIIEDQRKAMKRQWDAMQAERKAAYEAAKATQTEQAKIRKAQQSSQKRMMEAQEAERKAAIPGANASRAEAAKAQLEELQKARAAFAAQRAEQEEVLKARASAMKRQWEAQQAELQRARAAHDAEMERRSAEMQKMLEEREVFQRRQLEAFQAEMQKARTAQEAAMKAQQARQEKLAKELAEKQAAAKAKITKMLKGVGQTAVPPMPPRATQQPAPVMPRVMPRATPPAPPANQQQYGRNNSWGFQGQPRMGQQWQYGNQMHPTWRNNQFRPQFRPQYRPQYRPQFQPQFRQWQPPYPGGPGFYRPR